MAEGAAGAARQAGDAAQQVAVSTVGTAARIARAPLTVTGQLLGELTDSAGRPHAVLYWGGLAGAALLGAPDWPVALALGIEVAVARGRRAAG